MSSPLSPSLWFVRNDMPEGVEVAVGIVAGVVVGAVETWLGGAQASLLGVHTSPPKQITALPPLWWVVGAGVGVGVGAGTEKEAVQMSPGVASTAASLVPSAEEVMDHQ